MVVPTGRSGLVPGHERLDHRPLFVIEPKQRLVHDPRAIENLPELAVNHDLPLTLNRLIGFGA